MMKVRRSNVQPMRPPTPVLPTTLGLSALTWLMLMSTSVLAAGWAISRSFMMVAPSLLMVTLLPSKMSLSIPRGPRVVRTASATAWHALMLLTSWALPCRLSSERKRKFEQEEEKKDK